MEQTWKCFAALLLTCAITAQSSECRLLQQISGGAISRYSETPAAGRSCSTVCSNPLLFANVFKTQPASYACLVKSEPGLLGYQAGAGSTTCTVAKGSQVVESTDYSCMCLASSSIPGLAKPDAAGSCATSCKPYAGETGAPVSTNGNSVCMAAPEVGGTNHFGVASASGTCTYVSGNTVAQATSYSCVCAYGGSVAPATSNASLGSPFQLPVPLTQVQTAG